MYICSEPCFSQGRLTLRYTHAISRPAGPRVRLIVARAGKGKVEGCHANQCGAWVSGKAA